MIFIYTIFFKIQYIYKIRYWEVETCDIIKYNPGKMVLPSDVRYRSDLIALSQRDISKAEDEKLRLEVLQRADRALRQKFNKNTKTH
jgi:hypothetical protein